jgi:hypothetical protein
MDLKAVEVEQELLLPLQVEQSRLLVDIASTHSTTLAQTKHLLLMVLET